MDPALIDILAKALAREFYKVTANEKCSWGALSPEERSRWRHLVRAVELARGLRVVPAQRAAG